MDDVGLVYGNGNSGATTIVDRKSSLIVEVKYDSKDSSYEAMHCSNSPSTVASYVSIFEMLWKQSGMYEESQNQLRSAEEGCIG